MPRGSVQPQAGTQIGVTSLGVRLARCFGDRSLISCGHEGRRCRVGRCLGISAWGPAWGQNYSFKAARKSARRRLCSAHRGKTKKKTHRPVDPGTGSCTPSHNTLGLLPNPFESTASSSTRPTLGGRGGTAVGRRSHNGRGHDLAGAPPRPPRSPPGTPPSCTGRTTSPVRRRWAVAAARHENTADARRVMRGVERCTSAHPDRPRTRR